MNDKSIRKILIAYLQSLNNEIRIYQEKSIGNSICDVMVVSDCLTGYEIKSDLDNYSRLDEQIIQYNKFFDYNYIVVSQKHLHSAESKVPDSWGIICILDDKVNVIRKAKSNFRVSRRRQLSILWKIELKNILIKNSLPLFAQKEKGYIADKIAASVNADSLGKQIAQELLERDYSVYEAQDYTIRINKTTENLPEKEIVDTLSEENLEEFTLDKWIEMYHQAKVLQEKKNVIYVEKKVERIPHEIPYTDIEVSLGAPWISVDIINEFAAHMISYGENWQSNVRLVSYEPITGSWFVEGKKQYSSPNITVRFGTERFNALHILESTLNLREIKILDDGLYFNEAETISALEKQQVMVEEFKNWIWLDEDRRWQVEEEYNRLFAGFKSKKYDGQNLEFPDMNKNFSLFDYQKDAVQKIISTPNTLLAFDVGAGKTFIMIAAAMEMRRQNISRKNMFVVPNNIVGQWEKIFSDLYPKAKLLTVDPKTFKPEMRQKVLRQMQKGDYDGIIIAYSCFEMIPVSVKFVTDEMKKKVAEINDSINRLKNSYSWKWGSAPLEQEKKYIKKITNDFLDSFDVTPNEITFDSLEINTIFLDEAHNFKNLPIRTKLKNLVGINTTGSTKCMAMMQKIRSVQINNGGRGAVLATGTPLCNSISDAYAMQMYLQPEEMAKSKLDVFDNWVRTFAKPEQVCEVDVDTSKFRFVRRFSKFFNLPELSKMFSEVAIFHAVKTADGIPDFDEYTDVVIERSSQLKEYMESLCERTEAIRAKEVEKYQDNMLKVSTDGRKAALCLDLVGKKQRYDKCSKIYNCVKNVVKIYNESKDYTQLIFCDYSTPKGEDFSVYKELKMHLCENGIDEKEIAFIHSYKTESTKLKLFKEFNEGKIRIIIGSTFKLGIGANVQQKLKAIHHLDVPWRPADMVQREGRILRRGNENKDVNIYRYIAEGSFDSYSWQILETKQKFISQFLNGSSYQRSITDLENNILTYAEVKALALSQPLMKQLAEKENELRNARILLMQENKTIANLEQELPELKEKFATIKNRVIASKMAQQRFSNYSSSDFYKEARNKSVMITKEFLYQNPRPHPIRFLFMEIILPEFQHSEKPYVILKFMDEMFTVEMGMSPSGNIRRIVNFLEKFDTVVENTEKYENELSIRIKETEKLLNEGSDLSKRVVKLEKEKEELMNIIRFSDVFEKEPEVTWKE
ncbi:MAG: sce7726 family protein [Clostridia bacterium]|nr:sce7726 family protein [Clostridia bacterium]